MTTGLGPPVGSDDRRTAVPTMGLDVEWAEECTAADARQLIDELLVGLGRPDGPLPAATITREVERRQCQ